MESGDLPIAVVLGAGEAQIWGMTSQERHHRIFARLGLPCAMSPPDEGPALLVRGDWVVDEALMLELAKRPGTVLQTDDGVSVAAHVRVDARAAAASLADSTALGGLAVIAPRDLVYNSALRKREPPVLTRLDAQTVRDAEARTQIFLINLGFGQKFALDDHRPQPTE